MTASPREPVLSMAGGICRGCGTTAPRCGHVGALVPTLPSGRSKARRRSGPSPNHRGGWGDMPTQYLRTPTIHQGPASGPRPLGHRPFQPPSFSESLDGSTRIPRTRIPRIARAAHRAAVYRLRATCRRPWPAVSSRIRFALRPLAWSAPAHLHSGSRTRAEP